MTSLPFIAISQRVDILKDRNERRDALDQRWHDFLGACGFRALAMPNRDDAATDLLERLAPAGILLTGGNDLAVLGGDAPERDRTEAAMLAWAERTAAPAFGVCRGFQMIAHTYGAVLHRVDGHIATRHGITGAISGASRLVNSFHGWGFDQIPGDFEVQARAGDGTIEAMRHRTKAVAGVMWHPEREGVFDAGDITRLQDFFGKRL
jgi:gamma-glutamyl-gamma-aminobutyrate hydrolase PuuD